jgi:hypothetical protein
VVEYFRYSATSVFFVDIGFPVEISIPRALSGTLQRSVPAGIRWKRSRLRELRIGRSTNNCGIRAQAGRQFATEIDRAR